MGPSSTQQADLMLDTGAEYCSISTSMARLLGYDLKRQHRKIAIRTANGVIQVPSILITKVRIGNAYAHHVAVTCQDIPGVAGFIGLNFIRRCRTIIDYRKQTIDISRFKSRT